GVAGEKHTRIIRDFIHAAQMVCSKETRCPRHLLAKLECPSDHRRAICRAFLTNIPATPQHARIRLDDAVLLLDLPHTPLHSVVCKLGPMRADCDGEELIAGIPLKSPRTIGGEIAICVIRERFAGTRL